MIDRINFLKVIAVFTDIYPFVLYFKAYIIIFITWKTTRP